MRAYFLSGGNLRAAVIVLFLLVAVSTLAQRTDTLYIESYYNDLVPRVQSNFKVQTASFVTKTDTSFSADYFSTGGQGSVGGEVSYKWATLGYTFGFDRKNAATNTDFRFSTSWKPLRVTLNYTSLHHLDYYRVNLVSGEAGASDEKDTVFRFRQHNITLRNAGLKVDYVLNSRRCYYSSSMGQYARQLRSQGSFIVSGGIFYQDFDLRGLTDTARSNFLAHYPDDHLQTIKADLGLGYAYNWVVTKRLVIGVSDIPNIGFQQIRIPGGDAKPQATVSFTNYVRAGVTYTWKNRFAGVYAYNSVTAVRCNGYSHNNVYTSVQLHFGMVLGNSALRKVWKRVRSS
jgi:hypothetical protein